jgi:Co/Zn/Cd efflux system component
MKVYTKLFVILSISFLSVSLETVGAFYAKSLAMFSYAGLIMLTTFSFLPHLANLNNVDEGFRKAQIVSVFLNIAAILILVLIIISKAFSRISIPKDINMFLAVIITSIVFTGLIICFFISKKFLLQALASLTIIIGFSIPIFKNIIFLDNYLSIFFAICILVQSVILIKKSIKML